MQQSPAQPEPLTPAQVHDSLLPQLVLESRNPFNPVIVHHTPAPWVLLGAGNYAAVFCHPNFPHQVVKVYAPGRPGIEEEVEVYRRLGQHPAFSECFHAGETFLVLKRLHGTTLYDCLHQGIAISDQVIQDIDMALAFVRQRGLFPHDVHGRNVMVSGQRGIVVDVSDFLNSAPCRAWDDLKRGYYWLYRPLLRSLRIPIPYPLLDAVRQVYRWYRQAMRQL